MVEPPVYPAWRRRGAAAHGLAARGLRPDSLGGGDRAGRLGSFRAGPTPRRQADALAAVMAFSLLPITVRYGRAFQPDALMLGAVLAGLALLGPPRSEGEGQAGWSRLALAGHRVRRQGDLGAGARASGVDDSAAATGREMPACGHGAGAGACSGISGPIT